MNERAILRQAKSLARDGNVEEAERLYRQAATAPDRTADAVGAYARMLRDPSRTEEALAFLRQNREFITQEPSLLLQFEKILLSAGCLEEGIGLLEEGQRINPLAIELVDRLASRYLRAQEPAKALQLLQGAQAAPDDHVRYWKHARLVAATHGVMAQPELAAKALREASLESPPAPVAALMELAECELDTGNTEAADDVMEAARRAIDQTDPEQPHLWLKLGHLYQRAGELAAAEEAYRRSNRLSGAEESALPALVQLLFKMHRLPDVMELLRPFEGDFKDWQVEALAKALRLQGRLDEAAAVISTRAVQPNAGPSLVVENARLLSERGDFDKALAEYERARDAAGDPQAFWEERHWLALVGGALEDAWTLALNRKRRRRLRLPETVSLWTPGDALDGAPVVIAEQGIGDEIKFASCYPNLLKDAPAAIVTCDPRLKPVFERSFSGARFVPVSRLSQERYRGAEFLRRSRLGTDPTGAPLDASVASLFSEEAWREVRNSRQCILAGDLLGQYRRTQASFDSTGPLLQPDAELRSKWRQRLAALGAGAKIGLSWKGIGENPERIPAYASLQHWLPVLRSPNVHFVSLQHGLRDDELSLIEDKPAPLHRWDDFDEKDDLDDLAALIAELDLVISAHSMTKELAGALGADTWLVYHRADPQLAWRRRPDGRDLWFRSVRHIVPNVPTTPEQAISEVLSRIVDAFGR